MFFLHPVLWVHIVFRGTRDTLIFFGKKKEMARGKTMLEIWFSHFFPPPGMISTLRCCRLLWSCMSLQTSTSSKRYGQQINPNIISTAVTSCAITNNPPFFSAVGSSCGVSVCQVKPRRSTGWWRRLPHGTASATPESSSQQVRDTASYWGVNQSFPVLCPQGHSSPSSTPMCSFKIDFTQLFLFCLSTSTCGTYPGWESLV